MIHILISGLLKTPQAKNSKSSKEAITEKYFSSNQIGQLIKSDRVSAKVIIIPFDGFSSLPSSKLGNAYINKKDKKSQKYL